ATGRARPPTGGVHMVVTADGSGLHHQPDRSIGPLSPIHVQAPGPAPFFLVQHGHLPCHGVRVTRAGRPRRPVGGTRPISPPCPPPAPASPPRPPRRRSRARPG